MGKKKRMIDSIWVVLLSILAVLYVYPIIMILFNSMKKETAITTAGAVSYTHLGVMAFIVSHAFPIFDKMFKGYDKLNASVQENLTGIRVVKAYVREDHENKKFCDATDNQMCIRDRHL